MADTTIYNCLNGLPDITLIAGTDRELIFTVYEEDGVNISAISSATWLLCPYGNFSNNVLQLSTSGGDIAISGGSSNVLTVHIPAADTVSLSGKYIQQLLITDATYTFRPSQGAVLIAPATVA
jgi:hypothetical protein